MYLCFFLNNITGECLNKKEEEQGHHMGGKVLNKERN